jgi:TolB-like protein/class 3 adenylate cyclase
MERRLAVILAADVVGYSALMERDEAGTYERLTVRRKELFEPEIARHHGHIFKLMGDGLLAEFTSVVEAVECAVTLQRGLIERNAAVAPDQNIQVRIGINLGEVIVEGTDRYGEGVNIASRLQQLAEPSGICVSGKVALEVQKKLAFSFEPMGEQRVKNISQPIPVFRLKLDGALPLNKPSISSLGVGAASAAIVIIAAAAIWGYGWRVEPAGLPLPNKPSLAVMPFENVSGNERLGRLADGMVTDITNNLSRFSELFVIDRNSAFTYKGKPITSREVGRELGVRYLLEGAVQGDENKLRVSTQLVEAGTGKQLWSEQYDRPLGDFFAVQSDIMESIVGSISGSSGAVQRMALEEAKRRAPRTLDAYDLYLVATDMRVHTFATDNSKAEELFRKAIAIDPQLEPAWAQLALLYWNRVDYGQGDPATAMAKWLDAAQTAVQLDPDDALAHTALGLRYQFGNQFDLALREFNAALAANPNYVLALRLIGGNLPYLEKSNRAVQLVEKAMRLDPRNRPLISHMSKLAYYFNGDYEKAISEIHLRDDLSLYDYMFLALAHGELGQKQEAKKVGDEMLKLRSDRSAELFLAEGEFAPAAAANRSRFLDGWKKAGLPYCASPDQLSKHPGFVRLPECAAGTSGTAEPMKKTSQ